MSAARPAKLLHGHAGGTTLVELVIVLVVLAAFSVVAVPRVQNLMRHHRLDQVSGRMIRDISLTRAQAIRDKLQRSVIFEPDLWRYRLPEQPGQLPGEEEYIVTLDPATQPIWLVGADFGGTGDLWFDRFGLPATGGTVLLSDGVEDVVVTVSGTTGETTRKFKPAGPGSGAAQETGYTQGYGNGGEG